jgi:hypothetical protein
MSIIFAIAFTLLLFTIIPGAMLWMMCGAPSPRFGFAWMIVFAWPMILISKSCHEEYLRHRDRALRILWDEEERRREAAYRRPL